MTDWYDKSMLLDRVAALENRLSALEKTAAPVPAADPVEEKARELYGVLTGHPNNDYFYNAWADASPRWKEAWRAVAKHVLGSNGDPCFAKKEDGLYCTEPRGHAGQHIARGTLAKWPSTDGAK